MALIGKQLSKQIPASTTGNQAIAIFGILQASLESATQTLDAHNDPSNATKAIARTSLFGGLWTSLDTLFIGASDGGSVAAAQDYLNSTASMLSTYLADMPQSDAQLSEHQLDELRAAVSMTSVCVFQIDSLFSTSWASDLSDSIVEAIKSIPAAVASAVASVAGIVGKGMGSFIGGTWYIWVALGVGAYFYFRHKVRQVTS